MAAKPVNPESGLPNIEVIYDEKDDVLFITNGDDTMFGDSIANGVAMFYDRDTDEADASAVAMHIIGAKGQLKPFVDAILRQHGVEPPQPAAVDCGKRTGKPEPA